MRKIYPYPIVLSVCLILIGVAAHVLAAGISGDDGGENKGKKEVLLSNIRQLIFKGRRSGEGYFGKDGRAMVFQSERDTGNPFYQIYLMDLLDGNVTRVSPGYGKTTCSWMHPDGRRVLFASTHEDPGVRSKQDEETERHLKGESRRYSWDFDEHYDIYEFDTGGKQLRNLTLTTGYDAEGSWSPDGRYIVFASNRHAYSGELSPEERERFKRDPSYLMDIYIMNGNGSGVRRLTDRPGYDGGPFFSPDGRRIVWRHFSEDGSVAEIYTMKTDGTDKRQVTRLGVMSWAPFYHPSGDYIIFATNLHGHANFELYMVDTEGRSDPVRVTYTDGFDGLPVFMPDGRTLSWTATRTDTKQAQIFMADWDDIEARRLLGLEPSVSQTVPGISADDLRRHLGFIASERMAGRLTGSRGMRESAEYVASVLGSYGLEGSGEGGSFFQEFEYTAGVQLGPANRLSLSVNGKPLESDVDKDWRPLAFSSIGKVEPLEIVSVGYGIVAPGNGKFEAYDSYGDLDVEDKWVLVFRYLPEEITPEYRQHLNRYASLRYKAMLARDRGARGLIVVSGPNSKVKEDLVRLSFDTAIAGTSIAVISITDGLADKLLVPSGKGLKELQDELDTGRRREGFSLRGVSLAAEIDIEQERRKGLNVVARLASGRAKGAPVVIVGAHLDHLGDGIGTNSMARDDEKGKIHPGADDNASGISALLEMAQFLSNGVAEGRFNIRHDIIFSAWSGEELGLLGSSYFTSTFFGGKKAESIRPGVAAYINMDMVGRFKDRLVIQGVGSSSTWPGLIERANVPIGLPLSLQEESYLPTDATSFYLMGVPSLSAFTGAHEDYHTPRDRADKIDYKGMERVTRLMARIVLLLASMDEAPDYIEMVKPAGSFKRRELRATLGTIPDYSRAGAGGVRLSGVAKDGPAYLAGLKAGDTIVELAGREIENIYDYVYTLEALKIGVPLKVVIIRGEDRRTLTIIPGSRE